MLAEFAESVAIGDEETLAAARAAVIEAVGPAGLVDAAAIASAFNSIGRVADSTGIPIDEERLEPTAEFREALGINAFPSRTADG